MTEPSEFPDQMISRMPASRMPEKITANIPASALQPQKPQFNIEFKAVDGTFLLRLYEDGGCLRVVVNDERTDEAVKRFLHDMLRWSGQVGIPWKDAVLKDAEVQA